MSNGEFIYKLIEGIIFLSAFAGIIIKSASKFKEMDMKIQRLEADNQRRDSQYATILSSIGNVEQAIVRLEVSIEFMKDIKSKEGKNDN